MTNPTPNGQVPEALLLADQYAAAHAKWALEDLYGSSKSYTAEKLAERHAARETLERALRAAPVQNPAQIEHVAGDVSKNGTGLDMSTRQTPPPKEVSQGAYETGWKDGYKHGARSTQQPAPAGAIPKAAQIEAIWGAMDCPAPATQQAEVRPVTPYTCPKCHALWLHWPAEQTGFGRDTLNCRSADHCHYCEKASVEQLQRLERIPAALHAPQPSPTAQAADPDGVTFRTAARLGLTLRFYGGCAQSGMPGTPSAYEVVTGSDRAAAMREAVERASAVIAGGGESQRFGDAAQAAESVPAPVQSGLVATMLDALRHAQKVLNHNNLHMECGPVNAAILAARAPADSAIKDHQIAALVNELRDIAVQYHGTQQLRERIAQVVVPVLRAADSVLEDAARPDTDAAFEAARRCLCKIPRYSFALDSRGNVRRCEDKSGNWIEFDAAHALFDPVPVDAARKQGGA